MFCFSTCLRNSLPWTHTHTQSRKETHSGVGNPRVKSTLREILRSLLLLQEADLTPLPP